MVFLLKYWKVVVTALIFMLVLGYISILRLQLSSKETKLVEAKATIETQAHDLTITKTQLKESQNNIAQIKILSTKMKEVAARAQVLDQKIRSLSFKENEDEEAINTYNSMVSAFNGTRMSDKPAGSSDNTEVLPPAP
jgi:uncharacterized protein YpmS